MLDSDVLPVSCFAEVAAPEGRGRAAALTATVPAIETGCVACQKVPLTG